MRCRNLNPSQGSAVAIWGLKLTEGPQYLSVIPNSLPACALDKFPRMVQPISNGHDMHGTWISWDLPGQPCSIQTVNTNSATRMKHNLRRIQLQHNQHNTIEICFSILVSQFPKITYRFCTRTESEFNNANNIWCINLCNKKSLLITPVLCNRSTLQALQIASPFACTIVACDTTATYCWACLKGFRNPTHKIVVPRDFLHHHVLAHTVNLELFNSLWAAFDEQQLQHNNQYLLTIRLQDLLLHQLVNCCETPKKKRHFLVFPKSDCLRGNRNGVFENWIKGKQQVLVNDSLS